MCESLLSIISIKSQDSFRKLRNYIITLKKKKRFHKPTQSKVFSHSSLQWWKVTKYVSSSTVLKYNLIYLYWLYLSISVLCCFIHFTGKCCTFDNFTLYFLDSYFKSKTYVQHIKYDTFYWLKFPILCKVAKLQSTLSNYNIQMLFTHLCIGIKNMKYIIV